MLEKLKGPRVGDESEDERNIWIKLNIYGVLLIMDHKFQSIIELGEK